MTTVDPTKVIPRRDWVLVLMDQRKEVLDSGIVLPQEESGVEKVTEGSARILRVGPGKKNEALGLKVGDRIILRSYLKYANSLTCRLQWPDGRVKEHFLMATDDVFAVIPEGMEVGVFSRPQNKVSDKKIT
jgi:co-chaperonin GroES (HSP10)